VNIHGSNPTLRFESINKLKFFLLTRVLTQNSNTMIFVKFLENNQRLHIQIKIVTLKMTSYKTMRKKKKKKVKSQILLAK
jgi:hypothetical protein